MPSPLGGGGGTLLPGRVADRVFLGRLRRRPPDDVAAGASGEAWMPSAPQPRRRSGGRPCPLASAYAWMGPPGPMDVERSETHNRLPQSVDDAPHLASRAGGGVSSTWSV